MNTEPDTTPQTPHHSDSDYEKEMFSSMTGSQKAAHILTYYRWQLFGIFIAVAAVIYIIYHVLNPDPTAVLSIMLINTTQFPYDENMNVFTEEYMEDHGYDDPKKYELQLSTQIQLDCSNGYENIDGEEYLSFYAEVHSKTEDLLICEEDGFEYIAGQNFFQPLSSYLDEETLEKYQDCIYTAYNNETEEYYDCGLALNNCSIITESGMYNTNPVYVGLLNNDPNPEEALEYLMYLLEHCEK